MGAANVSTRENPPGGSNNGSAAATRRKNGSVERPVGSESAAATRASEEESAATTTTALGQTPTPHQSLAPASPAAPPDVASGVSKGKPPVPRMVSAVASDVWYRSAPKTRRAFGHPSMSGAANSDVGHCDGGTGPALSPSGGVAPAGTTASIPSASAASPANSRRLAGRGLGDCSIRWLGTGEPTEAPVGRFVAASVDCSASVRKQPRSKIGQSIEIV